MQNVQLSMSELGTLIIELKSSTVPIGLPHSPRGKLVQKLEHARETERRMYQAHKD